MKKIAGDILIWHMCTKNYNHMMYGSWDTEWDRQNLFSIRLARQNFLSFKAIFCPPLEDQENQNFQKLKKNTWRHYHFTHVHHIWQYHVWFPRYGAQQAEVFVILDSFLPFYPLMDPENQNFEKMKKKKKKKKKPMGILSFYTCAP